MENKNCPICKGFKLVKFLNRENVPVHQNYVFKSREEALESITGNLSICICDNCGFIFNSRFDSKKLRYGSDYDNTQDLSSFFKQYIGRELVYLKENFNLKGKNVIEVGCGKGTFLKQLVIETGCSGIGFDPSYIGEENMFNGNLKFIKDFYSEDYKEFKADFIICRHVIEHISNPVEFLLNINKSLENSKKPICFFETPSVRWILKNKVLYDFFYEHCSYFEDISIIKAFESTGFNVLEIKYEFSNQYMWIVGEVNKVVNNNSNVAEVEFLKKTAFEYSKSFETQIQRWKDKISVLNKKGKIAVWGAGAKGATFVNLVDTEKNLIDSVIDINNNKQGCFIPKTAHEIIDYRDIVNRDIKNVIIMNDNYFDEITKLLKVANININILKGVSLR